MKEYVKKIERWKQKYVAQVLEKQDISVGGISAAVLDNVIVI